jgi:mRNA interferase MazF
MINLDRGDVVLVDLGMAAKTRPCVVVSRRQPNPKRNLTVVVPMTTEIRGGETEIAFPKPPWLCQQSVVNVLGIAGVDHARHCPARNCRHFVDSVRHIPKLLACS